MDTTKVAIFANLVLVTPTEVNKNPATPTANVAANRDMKESNVIAAKVDTGERETNVKVWKRVFL